MFLYLDCDILDDSLPDVAAGFDAMLKGSGLFESFRAKRLPDPSIRLPFVDRHLARLKSSAEILGKRFPEKRLSPETLRYLISDLMKKNSLDDSDIRLILEFGPSFSKLALQTRPHEELPAADYSRGVKLSIAPETRDPDPMHQHKTTLRFSKAPLKPEAGALELLFVTPENIVTECSRYNFFALLKGKLLAPPVQLGLLPGVTRSVIFALMKKFPQTPLLEKPFSLDDLRDAEEAFISNALKGIVPVREVGKVKIPLPPNSLAGKLQRDYLDLAWKR